MSRKPKHETKQFIKYKERLLASHATDLNFSMLGIIMKFAINSSQKSTLYYLVCKVLLKNKKADLFDFHESLSK